MATAVEKRRSQLSLEAQEMLRVLDSVDKKMDRVFGDSSGGGAGSQRLTAFNTTILATEKILLGVDRALDFMGTRMRAIFDVGVRVEQSRLTWNALLGDVESVNDRLTYLQEFATSAPFTFEAIDEGSRQLEAMNRFSERAIQIAGDAAAVFGRDFPEATRAMLAAARGELDTIERFGVAKFEIAREMGVAAKDIGFQTAEDLDMIWEGMLRVMERKYGGGMEQLATSITGKISMIQDAWFKAQTEMAEGGLTDAASEGLSIVLNRVNDMLDDGTFARIGDLLGKTLLNALEMGERILGMFDKNPLNTEVADFAVGVMGGTRGVIEFGNAPNALGGLRQVTRIDPFFAHYLRRAAGPLAEGDEATAQAIIEEGVAAYIMRGMSAPGGGAGGSGGRGGLPPAPGAAPPPIERPDLAAEWAKEQRRLSELDELHGDIGGDLPALTDDIDNLTGAFREQENAIADTTKAWHGWKDGLQAAGELAMDIAKREIAAQIQFENLKRMSLRRVLQDTLSAIGEEATARAAFEAASALAMLAIGNVASAATHGKSAAAFGALAGASAFGYKQAGGSFDTAAEAAAREDAAAVRESSSSGSAGARAYAASATRVESIIITNVFNGSTFIAGDGGVGEFVDMMLPHIQDRLDSGALVA